MKENNQNYTRDASSGNRLDFDIQVRADEGEDRVFEGVASSTQVDTYATFFVPKGARYSLPIPLLWSHDREKPIGQVFEVKVSDKEVRFKARIAKDQGLSSKLAERLDEAWASVKSGLVRSVSIGFRPLKYTPVENGIIRFDEWTWQELSLVTVPANTDAKITAVRAAQELDNLKESGCHVQEGRQDPPTSTKNPTGQETKMTLQEKLAALKKTRQERADALSGLMERTAQDEITLSDEDGTRFDALSEELKTLDADIARCERAMQVAAASAAPVVVAASTTTATREATLPTASAPARVSLAEKEVKGAMFARYCQLLARSKGSASDMLMHAQEFARNTGDGRLENLVRAAVSVGTTQTGNWAAKLVDEYSVAQAEFLDILRPQTIVGQLNLSPLPFYVPVKEQTIAGVANWVGEGQAKPATSQGFDKRVMLPHKLAAITVISEELLKYSNPKADQLIVNDLTWAISGAVDLTFTLPTFAGSASAPASVTYGAANSASSGNTFANVITDLQTVKAHYINNRLPLSGVVAVMNPITASALASMRSDLGVALFPNLSDTGGNLEGFRVVVSEHIPFDSTGALVVFVRERDVYLGDNEGLRIDTSREATIEMSTNPTVETGTLVNLFQDNLVAIRAEREISWMKARAQAAYYLTAVNWGSA